jgi:hypothetical protein
MRILKNYWVVVGTKKYFDYDSIHYTRKGSIEKFLNTGQTWEHCKKMGWKCKKVNIIIDEVDG